MTRFILLVFLALLTTGCYKQNLAPDKKPAVKVEKLAGETEIGRITLTSETEQHLGIAFAPITEHDIQQHRTLGGDVLIPAGKSIAMAAPFSGTVLAPFNATIPTPGQRLELASPVLTLAPILTPERDVPTPAEQVQMANARATLLAAIAVAQGDRQRGLVEVNAAKIALDRAEKLFADRAGSERAVDDAQALLNVNESMLSAAAEREKQLTQLVQELNKPTSERTAAPLMLSSPQTGVLRSISVTPGQAVTAGTMLFEVVDTDTMWIRVPVYVEMLAKIDSDKSAQIVSLGATPVTMKDNNSSMVVGQNAPKQIIAAPVSAPPSADALNSSVDLYFECKNLDGELRPGQRVGVQLALRGHERGLTAPRTAILYDIFGGTWIYLRTAEHVYQRQRVLVRYVLGDRVVLAESPAADTQVVTDGAAELYGIEFGVGK